MRLAIVFLCACSSAPLPKDAPDLSAEILAGQPCVTPLECPPAPDPQYTRTCLDGPRFPGGTCVQPCAHGFGCPAPGMSCRTIERNGSVSVCFRDCARDEDCRAGYACCPSWNGGLGGPSPVCYPAPCP